MQVFTSATTNKGMLRPTYLCQIKNGNAIKALTKHLVANFGKFSFEIFWYDRVSLSYLTNKRARKAPQIPANKPESITVL